MDKGWRPLSARDSASDEYETLVGGVPPHLKSQLIAWIQYYYIGHVGGDSLPSVAHVKAIELRLRRALDWGDQSNNYITAHQSLLAHLARDDEFLLDGIDLALYDNKHRQGGGELESILAMGGSRYCVAPDKRGLTQRVPGETQGVVEDLVAEGSRAGKLLGEAWRHVYGRHPNPGEGYHRAVNAIEIAAIPVVTPNDQKSTLGRVIGELRANKRRFSTAFLEAEKGIDAVIDLMEVVWKSHHDRHGTPDEMAPISVSQAEAEAAVHAALLLVHWFRTNVIHSKAKGTSS